MKGLEAALTRKRRETPPRQPVFDGRAEARLVATCCSEPPAGRVRWTLRLLADRLVRLDLYLRATTPSIATRECPLVPTTTSSMVCAAEDVQLNE